jgi:hypothetical protein
MGVFQLGVRDWATDSRPEREQPVHNLLRVRLALTAIGVTFAQVSHPIAGYGNVAGIGTALVAVGAILTVSQGTACRASRPSCD